VLTITPAAAQVIDKLADASPLEITGLRMTHAGGSGALSMGLVEEPESDDAIIGAAGTRALVFLDPCVLPRLEGVVLDVKTEPGAAAFFLRDDGRTS
jgi:Fe-S cluster assembly iron-binding protein IscA